MAPGHTLQAPDTITPIGPSGPVPTECGARAPGTPTSSSASHKWPQATPYTPPRPDHPNRPHGARPHRMRRARPGNADVLVGIS